MNKFGLESKNISQFKTFISSYEQVIYIYINYVCAYIYNKK